MNYSIDCVKKSIFVDELNNLLLLLDDPQDQQIVIDYLKKRIKEIDDLYSKN